MTLNADTGCGGGGTMPFHPPARKGNELREEDPYLSRAWLR
jgi:hypothetical protein